MISSFWGVVKTPAMTVTLITAMPSSCDRLVAIVRQIAAGHIRHTPDIHP
jgi:hypothetical protein